MEGAANAAVAGVSDKSTGRFGVGSGWVRLDPVKRGVFTLARIKNGVNIGVIGVFDRVDCDFGLEPLRRTLGLVVDGTNGGFAELYPLEIGVQGRFGVAKDPVGVRVAIQNVRVEDCL